jgi:hypothetical protein
MGERGKRSLFSVARKTPQQSRIVIGNLNHPPINTRKAAKTARRFWRFFQASSACKAASVLAGARPTLP